MPDEPTAPADEQDKPTSPTDDASPETAEEQAPEQTGEAEGVNLDDFDLSQVPDDADRGWFEGRYNDLRADYTRKTQELADQRKQVNAIVEAIRDSEHPNHAEAMEFLGLEEVADDDEDDWDFEDDDTPSPIEQRIAALETERQQALEAQQQAQAEAAMEDYLTDEIESLQRREGIDEFTEDELALLVNAAVAMPDDRGNPDVTGAYARFKGAFASRQKAWLDSKKAPRGPGDGVPASAELDVTDRQARIDEATRIAEAAMGG